MSVSPNQPDSPLAATGTRPAVSPWIKLAIVAAILGGSGGARIWRQAGLDRIMDQGRSSPFPLAELPMVIGPWEGRPTSMDPKIVRMTGGTDLVTRHYVDRRTGVGLDVIVLYGPTFEVASHTPEVCYPSAGYDSLPGVFERSIPIENPAREAIPFRSLAYFKGDGGTVESQEVYYSLRYGGRWTTRTADGRASKRIPGVYKVQVVRRLSARERRDLENPCEPFLAALVGEIEARLGGDRPGSSKS